MELHLNLLPKKKKQETKMMVALSLVKDILSRSGIIMVFLIFFLTLINYTLVEQLKTLEDSSNLVNKGYANYNFEVAEINKKIASITAAGKQYKMLTPRLIELMQKIPDNIKLNSTHLDLYSTEIILPGVAKSREDLLAFDEELKKIEWIESTSLPTSQLFQKDNIPFEIRLKVKLPIK